MEDNFKVKKFAKFSVRKLFLPILLIDNSNSSFYQNKLESSTLLINTSSINPFHDVSVIVPVFNGEKTIINCVESLLNQTYPIEKIEIILIDNKSTDDTVLMLEKYVEDKKIILLSETKILNAYGARNAGIKAAKGSIIAFTDSDCIAESNWIEELTNSFSDPEIGCLAGEILPLPPRSVIEKFWDTDFLSHRRDIEIYPPRVLGGNCAYRREVIDKIGLFRDDFPSGGDAELALRMIKDTNKRIMLNIDAIVRHRNVSTLGSFIKQSFRYGSHILKAGNLEYQTSNKQVTCVDLLKITTKNLVLFLYHTFQLIFGKVPKIAEQGDSDIYVFRPILLIIQQWCNWWGSRYSKNNPKLIR